MSLIAQTSTLLISTILWIYIKLASILLELDGDRFQMKSFSDDPFENANVIPPTSTSYLENVSDISDKDFDIPCSQKQLSSSWVAGTMVACSSSVDVIACSNLSQVPPLHMHVGK